MLRTSREPASVAAAGRWHVNAYRAQTIWALGLIWYRHPIGYGVELCVGPWTLRISRGGRP